MDPTAALRDLLDAFRNHDRETAFDRLEALLDGLSKGGAFPTVSEPDVCYQGWANHATWCVHLWLSNDHGTWQECRELACEAIEDADECDQVCTGIWTRDEAQRFILADRLKDDLAERNPLPTHPSAFADLLHAALDDVNYEELAKAFLDDLIE